VAYAVGRSAGNAVRRNRARRRLRAAVDALDGHLAAGAYLFGAGEDVVSMDFAELGATVEQLVRDAGAAR
jgi:ribonuclease P protein component